MALHRKNHILTLVLTTLLWGSTAIAAPDSTMEPEQLDTGLIERPNEEPIIPTRKLVKEATTSGGGVWLGSVSAIDANDSLLYFKLSQNYYDPAERASEYSLYIISNGQIGWSAGLKWLQDLGYRNEPYFKIAIAALYQPSENIGTIINWKRYQIIWELGFDDLFKRNRSLRAEIGIAGSGLGVSYYIGGSYAF